MSTLDARATFAVLIALAAAGPGCGGAGDAPVDAPTSADAACAGAPVRDVAYQALPGVAAGLQALDIYPPCLGGAPAPVVIWVHGGAWAIGDKANSMADKVALWNGAGYLVVSVNYRLSPDTAELDPARVRHPIHAQDVAAAIAWVEEHVADHGGDPTRIALVGHSAGAHLVALIATDPQFLAAHQRGLSSLRCVGSLDTEAYDIPRTMQTAAPMQSVILRNAFGDDPAVWAAASPVTHVRAGAGIPPFLLVRRGDADRQATEQAFHDRLRAAGVASTLVDASSLTHEEVNASIGAAGDQVMTAPLAAFLAGCLR